MKNQLYTSLMRLKMVMSDGSLPPMTPLPVATAALLDPALTIGMGAVIEDPIKGYCRPVRGCGTWHRNLATHASRKHRSIGGAAGLRRLLDIPRDTPLCVTSVSDVLRESAISTESHRNLRKGSAKGAPPRKQVARVSLAQQNFKNRCDAQLAHAMADLCNELRRAPSRREAVQLKGYGWVHAIETAYGSWAAATAQYGVSTSRGDAKKKWSRELVLEALKAWHARHGDLPTSDWESLHRGPVLPAVRTIMAAFGARSWSHAMEIAASLLGIYGGRYGLPEEAA